MLQEISYHLNQGDGVVSTTLSSPITAGANQTATIPLTTALYTGAQLIVDIGQAAQEIITVVAVTSSSTFIATFANSHSAGAAVTGATFPLQATTDPIYTTDEISGYLSRAQNQFLQDVPCSFKRLAGQTISSLITATPADAIEMERVAVQVSGKYTRLYATTQEELSMTNPNWRQGTIAALQSWAEDRSGAYAFAVNGNPATPFTAEYLYSNRDSDSLALTDGFLVADPVLHYVKYKTLDYAFGKDGEYRDPLRAQYCSMRYQRGVMAVARWMTAMGFVLQEEQG